jgi:hypothetical protein
MALITADRVKEVSTTTGTGALTLGGAITGFVNFSDRLSVGDTCYYAIQGVDNSGVPTGEWEVGLGTYSAIYTLTRTSILASSNGGAVVSLSGGNKQVYITQPAIQASWPRERLTVSRTYYVATTGSNLNDGLTAGTPFLTIQKAVDVVAAIDKSIYTVVIQLADGTYAESVNLLAGVGSATVVIKGNAATPSNVHVNATGVAFGIYAPTTYQIQDMKISATSICLNTGVKGALLNFSNVVFGTAGNYHMQASGGTIQAVGNYSIVGSASIHAITLYQGSFIAQTRTVTLLASITVTNFVAVYRQSMVNFEGTTFSLGAFTVTGQRYYADLNSVIYGTTGNASFFPGTVAGAVATGAQYA